MAVSDLTGLAERDGTADVAEIFLGDSRTVETRIGGVWALGPMSANVTVTPSVDGATRRAPT